MYDYLFYCITDMLKSVTMEWYTNTIKTYLSQLSIQTEFS